LYLVCIKARERSSVENREYSTCGTTKINNHAGCFDDGIIGWAVLVHNHVGDVSFAAIKLGKIRILPRL